MSDGWSVIRLAPGAGSPRRRPDARDADPRSPGCRADGYTCLSQDWLGLAGLESYFPRTRNRVVRHGRRRWRVSELFPGYGFVRRSGAWLGASALPSVVAFVGDLNADGRPARVARSEVDKIAARQDARGFVDVDAHEKFLLGERVRVGSGTMVDLVGSYVGLVKPGRAVIHCELLGARGVPVEVSEGDLVAA